MPRKLRNPKTRADRAEIRPSVLIWLETGDKAAMQADNPWLLVGLPLAARHAYERGDLVAVRELLAAAPGGRRNYFVKG